MKLRNVRAIIWDLDGTLLDSFQLFFDVVAEIAAERGLTMPSREVVLHNFHGSLEESIEVTLGIKSANELADIVDRFLEKQDVRYQNLDGHLFNDAVKLAMHAAEEGVVQLLLTNRAHKKRGHGSPRAIVAASVLADCIHEVRCGDELVYKKPSAHAALDWLEKHELEASEVIVIGDQNVDAELADNLGARAILVKRHDFIPHYSDKDTNDTHTIVKDLHGIQIAKASN